MNWYIKVLKQFSDFQGRARRQEYWMYTLFNFIFAIVAIILDNVLGLNHVDGPIGPIYLIYGMIVFVPGLAVSVRRLHDTGNSGWMIFISLIPIIGTIWLLVLMVTEGDKGANKYGANPKNSDANELQSFSMEEEKDSVSTSTRDIIILIVVIWTFISQLFWQIISFLNADIDFYDSTTFIVITVFSGFVWTLVPFALAFIVKNKSIQILLYIISIILMFFEIYNLVKQFNII